MAYVTLVAFVNGLEALQIEGVNRRYIHGPPASATNKPDVPALFIAYPVATGSKLVFKGQGGAGTLTAQLHVVVKAVAQDYQERNFDSTVRMVDALESALFDLSCSLGPNVSWKASVTVVEVAGQAYWAAVADVESGRW